MNGQTWSIIGVIFGIIFGGGTLYLLARSSSNETKRRTEEIVAKAVEKATKDTSERMQLTINGHVDTIASHLATINRLYGRLDIKDRRIEELEDQLRNITRGMT